MGIATRIVQVAPTASVIDHVIGTSLTATWRLETLEGTPIPNRTLGLFIDHGTAPYVNAMTNSSGLVSSNIGSHGALYVGSTWDFDARFAGDATYDASVSPYITLNVVASSQTCRDIHPTEECINDYIWDCLSEQWVNTGVFCGVVPPTCREEHPTSLCINDYIWDCVNGVWVNTGVYCGPAPVTCREQHPVAECIGGMWYDCVGESWQGTGYSCEQPPPPTVDVKLLAIAGVAFFGAMGFLLWRLGKK